MELLRHWEQQAPQCPCCRLEEVLSRESLPSRKCRSGQRPGSHPLNTKCHRAQPRPHFQFTYVVTKKHPDGGQVTLPLPPEWACFQVDQETVAATFANPGFEQPTRRKSSTRSGRNPEIQGLGLLSSQREGEALSSHNQQAGSVHGTPATWRQS